MLDDLDPEQKVHPSDGKSAKRIAAAIGPRNALKRLAQVPLLAGERLVPTQKWEKPMKLSARNVLKGKVTEIKKGAVAAQVRVDVGGGNIITSTVTVDAVDDLKLAMGSEVSVIIKASEVILGVKG